MKRRLIVLLTTGAMSLMLLATPVLAASFIGTDDDDVIFGTRNADRISGLDGHDRLGGGGGNDRISGGDGHDVIFGGRGDDVLRGDRGQDRIAGGMGNDRIGVLDGDDDQVFCGTGFDRVIADEDDVVSDTCEVVRIFEVEQR